MKFDAVVGNPPYQDSNVGDNNQAPPVYHLFYELSEKISPRYILISPARFLANQGATPKLWNQKMLNDNHLNIEYFNIKSNEVFPNIDIKGGIVIIYRDINKVFEKIDTFIPSRLLRNIFYKVKKVTDTNLSNYIYSPDSYRFSDTLFIENPSLIDRTDKSHAKAVASSVFARYPEIFFTALPNEIDNYIQLYGRENGKRVYKWVKRDYLSPHDNLDKWKVFIPGANGTGLLGEALSAPIIASPGIAHNQTFISIGKFNTEFEANSLIKYIKSKFSRMMLGVMKITQNNQSKNTWSKVPMQDFTPDSDIDWSKSIAEIDQQLYQKYGLDQDEIDFIEKQAVAME